MSMLEHKIYCDGKPVEYRITIDSVQYRYYPGKGSVYCKTKGPGVMPCNYLLDLESGKTYSSRGQDDASPEWKIIREKFRSFV